MQTIGIVGMGLMGRNIAACLLSRGLRVIAFTRPSSGFTEARAAIAADLEDVIAHGAAPASLRDEWPARYVEAGQLSAMSACDFVMESVFEDLAVKQAVLDELEAVLPEQTPIGTNTSAIPISLLQQGRRHPQRVIGMHWCPPCTTSLFLEIIRGEQTGEAAVQAALALGRIAGKEAGIVRKDVPGFIANRLAYAIYREALNLVESGIADIETVDTIFKNVCGMWGSIMGPMRWMDLTGLPAYEAGMQRVLPTLSNSTEVPRTLRELVASGATGAAGGRGFYRYQPGEADELQRQFQEHCWRVRKALDEAAGQREERRS